MRNFWKTAVAAVGMVLASSGGYAQTIKSGTIEGSIFGGVGFDMPSAASAVGICFVNTTNCGLKYAPGAKAPGLAGVGLGLSLYKGLSVYGDYSYVFKQTSGASVNFFGTGDTATAVRQYSLAVGGLQMAIPSVQRFSPYVEIGGGELHNSYNLYETITNLNGNNYTFDTNSKAHPNLPVIHYGGGVRYFVGERWGLKFAVNGYKTFRGIDQAVPTSGTFGSATVSRRGFGDVTLGLFWRLGRR